MDFAKAHAGTTYAIPKTREAALRMAELPHCFGEEKEMTGF